MIQFFIKYVMSIIFYLSFIYFFSCAESDIYEDPSVRFESKKILQPDPINMENYLVNDFCRQVDTQLVDSGLRVLWLEAQILDKFDIALPVLSSISLAK